MKIVRKDYVRDGAGSFKLLPEESDDLWHTYNLIARGDVVTAITFRKVLVGKRDSERVRMKLDLQVEEVNYDKDGAALRVRGKNILENEHVRYGAFHTLELALKRPFVLKKKVWDSVALDTLKQASESPSDADLAVVLMQEGLAQIFLVGTNVLARARIETTVPNRKQKHGDNYEYALKRFFENVAQAFEKHVDLTVVRCAVIAGPGLTKDQFHSHLLSEAERRQKRDVIKNKSRILLAHATSCYKHSLKEVLNAPNVMNMIKDAKAAKEVKALSDFLAMLKNDPHRACYGSKHVEVAHERMAIQTLLITDELFRSQNVGTRKKYVEFVEAVKALGGEVFVFASNHVSGERLAQHTGIAALLRFPLPDLDDI